MKLQGLAPPLSLVTQLKSSILSRLGAGLPTGHGKQASPPRPWPPPRAIADAINSIKLLLRPPSIHKLCLWYRLLLFSFHTCSSPVDISSDRVLTLRGSGFTLRPDVLPRRCQNKQVRLFNVSCSAKCRREQAAKKPVSETQCSRPATVTHTTSGYFRRGSHLEKVNNVEIKCDRCTFIKVTLHFLFIRDAMFATSTR